MKKGENAQDALEHILDLARKYSVQRGHKIQIMALAPTCDGLGPKRTFTPSSIQENQKPDFMTRVWLELDSIPFLASKDSTEGKFSLDAQASAAVDEALAQLVPMSSSTIKISLSPLRQVLGAFSRSTGLSRTGVLTLVVLNCLATSRCRLPRPALLAPAPQVNHFACTLERLHRPRLRSRRPEDQRRFLLGDATWRWRCAHGAPSSLRLPLVIL